MVKTIKISDKTHERIRKKGNKGETYEDIIIGLLDNDDTRILIRSKGTIQKGERGD